VIAGTASFSQSAGAFLQAGARIGSMLATGPSSPALYFELRDAERAIEPRLPAR
jgi:septal ring factor EnvC (AmiA/AmiB activator)